MDVLSVNVPLNVRFFLSTLVIARFGGKRWCVREDAMMMGGTTLLIVEFST